MAEVLLSSDELTVIGGPEIVDVSVDFGPQGDRGSYFFAGIGNPNEIEIGADPKVGDIYINTQSTTETASYIFQYQQEPGGYVWNQILKLYPNIYATNKTDTFTNGVMEINIPVINIVKLTTAQTLTAANFNIQHNILGNNPISSSLTINEVVTLEGLVTLPISINAIEYVDGSWSEMSGSKTVHLLITVV